MKFQYSGLKASGFKDSSKQILGKLKSKRRLSAEVIIASVVLPPSSSETTRKPWALDPKHPKSLNPKLQTLNPEL